MHEKEVQKKDKKQLSKNSNVDDKTKRRVKQKIEERIQIAKKEDEIAKIRNSPRLLSDMIASLSDDQKQWVRDAGFESLLHFELVEMPQRLAYKILEVYDEKSCNLLIKRGDIQITEQAVHDVLGVPCRGAEIEFAQEDRIYDRINQWRSQFPTTEGQSLVKASEVVDNIKQTGEVDEIFKMNFMVVMTNVLIRSNTNNFVSQTILSFKDEFDNCKNYNWAAYLIKSLVITKQRWMRTTSLFYTGPMIFLLILYVDRVLFQGKKLVPRRHPTFRGWTKENLKEREVMEAEDGAFGSGEILPVVTVEELEANEGLVCKDKEDASDEKMDSQTERADVEDNNGPNANDEPHEDWWKTLNLKAALLIDVNIQLTEAKTAYESQLANAKELHPDDEKILEIEKRIKDLFKENKWMDSESNMEDDFQNIEKIAKCASQEEGVGLDTVDAIEDNELPPYHDDHLDLIAWLKSPEGIMEFEKDIQDPQCPSVSTGIVQDVDDLQCPSFSLGISQICKDVMEEHGKDDESKEGDDNETPLPPKEPEKRTKRDMKVGPAYRSPYIQRNIDVNASYSKQEIAVYRWMMQEHMDLMESVFVSGEQTLILDEVKTLMPEKHVSCAVIDMLSILMNGRENYKSTEAPMRLYMDIGFSIGPLDLTKSHEAQYAFFKSEMKHFFDRYPNRKIENADLIFFPVLAYEHLYMVSFNLKNPAVDVIDNIRRGRSAGKEYGEKLKLLRRHFVNYLVEIKLKLLGSSLKKVKPSYMVMPWQTLSNYTDCGIFLMRHLETYKGDPNNWQTDLKVESIAQKTQLLKLRAKYCHAILASPLNQKKQHILNEAKALYKKIALEKVMSIVLAASEGKKAAVRGRNDIKGKVLFPENDTQEDNN